MLKQKCVGCGVVKPHTRWHFYSCKTGRNGLRIKCKKCVRADSRENYEVKKEFYAERRRAPEQRARRRMHSNAWRKTPRGRTLVNESQRFNRRLKKLLNQHL